MCVFFVFFCCILQCCNDHPKKNTKQKTKNPAAIYLHYWTRRCIISLVIVYLYIYICICLAVHFSFRIHFFFLLYLCSSFCLHFLAAFVKYMACWWSPVFLGLLPCACSGLACYTKQTLAKIVFPTENTWFLVRWLQEPYYIIWEIYET